LTPVTGGGKHALGNIVIEWNATLTLTYLFLKLFETSFVVEFKVIKRLHMFSKSQNFSWGKLSFIEWISRKRRSGIAWF
jgi:hypothetical protein